MKTPGRIRETGVRMQNAASRTTPQSRARCSRFDLPRPTSRAFTLIELLIVTSVIALLAGLTFPVMTAVRRAGAIHRAQAEIAQIETAIESYKTKLGYYPPDNPANRTLNQLYYELLGTTNIGTAAAPIYTTLDGSAQIKASDFLTTFGSSVSGFQNCARGGGGDEVPTAVSFLNNLKPAQFLAVTNPVAGTVLGSTIGGTPVFFGPAGQITPYGYNSSNPQHNPKSFDLWIDLSVAGKTNRISNWSEKPIFVSTTSYP